MNKLDFFRKLTGVVELEKVGEVHIDSRKIVKDDIFIAIRSGNDYVKKALEKGAAFVFYDDKNIKISDKRAIHVEDSIRFLQKIAKDYRETLNVKIIGITGSEGKTSTKDILYTLLSSEYKGKKTNGNYNNHLGVPLTLLRLEEDDEFLALEMGMSELGEIKFLSEIASPDYAIVTNIGDSHLEFLKTRDNVFKAKTELLEYVEPKNRILYGNDPYLKILEGKKVGYNIKADYRITNFVQNKEGSKFKLEYLDSELELVSNLYGKYNALNLSFAIGMAIEMNVPIKKIKESCKNLKLTEMRFEKVNLYNKIFINDAYNASPVAMKVSLETFDETFRGEYKVAVLGDMLELGEESRKLHEDLSKVIEKLELDEIYLVGDEMRYLYEKVSHHRCFYCKKVEEIKERIKDVKNGACILLKASNGISLNTILN